GGNGCTDGSFGDAYSVAATYKNGPITLMAAWELHTKTNRQGDDNSNPQAIAAGATPVILPNGQGVMTRNGDGWAGKVGGGYRFNDGIGDVQLYAYYEWLRRDVPAGFEPFNERQRDGVFASATQFWGRWSFSASYAHAFATPGNPATLSVNDPVLAPAASIQANLVDDSANMVALGTRFRFNQWASWYLVGSHLWQGTGAHYCLGPSGHGYALCGRDAQNDTIGGATLSAVTTGLTFD